MKNRFSSRLSPLLLVCFAALYAGCEKPKPTAMAPPTVEVVEVQQKDVPVMAEWVGTADGYVNAQIKPQVTGYLMRQNYKEGTLVKKGDLLFEIDPREFQAAVDNAKGSLGAAQARLGKTEMDVTRYTPLAKENAISQQELDDAIQANLAAKADVDSAQAALETAKLNLSFTKITSPVDGIAGLAQGQVGDLVGPSTGSVLTTISTIDPIKFYFTVSEQEYIGYARLYPTDATKDSKSKEIRWELILSDGTTYTHPGTFFAANRQVDVRTGAIQLAALFPNPNSFLRPGQFGRVRAQLDVLQGALLVPQRSVTELQGNYQVAVVGSDNKVDIRPVTVGERFGTMWVISKGLKPGERVIAEGTQKAKQGMPVTPKTAAVEPQPNASQPASNPG